MEHTMPTSIHRSLRERVASMTPDELHAAMRATAEGDRTYRAKLLLIVFDDDDRLEVTRILEEDWDRYVAAAQELLPSHPEL